MLVKTGIWVERSIGTQFANALLNAIAVSDSEFGLPSFPRGTYSHTRNQAVLKYLMCLATLLLLATSVTGQGASPVTVGHAYVLHSKVLDADRGYRVALPEGYAWSPDTRYPVLYVLDAQEQFAHTATTVAFMAYSGQIPPTIVVGLDSGNRVHDYTQTDWPEAWVGGGGAAQFQAFLNKELIPAIESRWRTNGFRTLMGHSASGQFALHELATTPGEFRAYFILSPSLDWDHGLPQRELAAAFAKMKSLPAFVYFAYSNDFDEALAADLTLAETLQAHAPQGLRREIRSMPTESHVGMALRATIDALSELYPHYRYNPDHMDRGIDTIQAHYLALSKIVGWSLPVPEDTINNLGYRALSENNVEQAMVLFRRNVSEHPLSANAYDSLADGYAAAKHWNKAAEASDHAAALARKYDNPMRAELEKRATKYRAQADGGEK